MSRATHEALLGALPQPLVVLDGAGAVAACNPAARRLLCGAEAAIRGRSLFALLVPGPEVEAAARGFVPAMERGAVDLAFRATAASASARPPVFQVRLQSFVDDGETFCLGSFLEDIGAEAAVEVVAKVKHDVNNVLMGLLGHATLLLDRGDLTDPSRKRIETIAQLGRRIRERIADLDGFLRSGRGDPAP